MIIVKVQKLVDGVAIDAFELVIDGVSVRLSEQSGAHDAEIDACLARVKAALADGAFRLERESGVV